VSTPYEALGVSPDASPEEIKAAHRAAVKRHHPDTGGNVDAFTRAQKAYKLLSDPEKRRRYDATGEDGDAQDQPMAVAMQIIADVIEEIFKSSQEPRDFIGCMRAMVWTSSVEIDGKIAMAEHAIFRQERVRKRLKPKAADPIGRAIDQRIAVQKVELAKLNTLRDGLQKATEIIDSYETPPEDTVSFGPAGMTVSPGPAFRVGT